MIRQHKAIIWFVLWGVLGSCQWHGLRHRELMPGIKPNKEAYEKTVSKQPSSDSGTDVAEEVHGPQTEKDRRQATVPHTSDGITGILLPAPLKNGKEIILRRTGYVTSYHPDNKICNWVAWHLTDKHTAGAYQRKGVPFQEDMDVPAPRATNWDYSRSGYDRGHMCPASDNKWSEAAMRDCFLFTNMCPQNHQLNSGDWNELEMRCRRWARTYGSVHIVCGPILFRQKHKTIGKNKVVVPEAFFKVVLCMEGIPKGIGFIYRNEAGNRPQGDYVNSIDEVERITGIDFFADLPDDIEEKVERTANPDDWSR